MSKVFIFGTNALSEILAYYLRNTHLQFDGLILNEKYVSSTTYSDLHLFSAEEMIQQYGRDNISVYLTIGYAKMNGIRETVYNWIKNENVRILSYKHPSAIISDNAVLGEGNIVLENCTIQPFVNIGNANIIWNNSSVCHHSKIGSFNYISPSVTIAGRVRCGDRNFIGANSTIKNDLIIKDNVLIGASAYVSKNLESNSVLLPSKSTLIEDKSSFDYFIK